MVYLHLSCAIRNSNSKIVPSHACRLCVFEDKQLLLWFIKNTQNEYLLSAIVERQRVRSPARNMAKCIINACAWNVSCMFSLRYHWRIGGGGSGGNYASANENG